ISAKGRLVRRDFGGGDTVALGTATIGVPFEAARPDFTLGPQSHDKVRQGTVGVTYAAQWQGVGEISGGLQKTFYRRDIEQPNVPLGISRNNPWLYNGTIAAFITNKLTLYASYTRGLEESGVAPDNASNPNEALPASLTEQLDAGLRYRITPNLTMIAGVFEVSKPYFDRNAANLFTQVGSLRHRGVEFSLSGSPVDGLTVVAGAVLLEARVSGFTVDQGIIGE
ncbi:MAG: TonB-dependent receptor, partial [Rhodospirillaceae bacterium]